MADELTNVIKQAESLKTDMDRLRKDSAFQLFMSEVDRRAEEVRIALCANQDAPEPQLRSLVSTFAAYETIKNLPEILTKAAEMEAEVAKVNAEAQETDNAAHE